jgi:hypothetical protein
MWTNILLYCVYDRFTLQISWELRMSTVIFLRLQFSLVTIQFVIVVVQSKTISSFSSLSLSLCVSRLVFLRITQSKVFDSFACRDIYWYRSIQLNMWTKKENKRNVLLHHLFMNSRIVTFLFLSMQNVDNWPKLFWIYANEWRTRYLLYSFEMTINCHDDLYAALRLTRAQALNVKLFAILYKWHRTRRRRKRSIERNVEYS